MVKVRVWRSMRTGFVVMWFWPITDREILSQKLLYDHHASPGICQQTKLICISSCSSRGQTSACLSISVVCSCWDSAWVAFWVLLYCWKSSKTERASKALALSGLILSSQCSPSSLSFPLCSSSFVDPPLMCKWLDDRAEQKHKLCFPGSGYGQNSCGFTAVRISQILTG